MKGFERFFHDRHGNSSRIDLYFIQTNDEVFNNSIHNRLGDILIRLLINPFGL